MPLRNLMAMKRLLVLRNSGSALSHIVGAEENPRLWLRRRLEAAQTFLYGRREIKQTILAVPRAYDLHAYRHALRCLTCLHGEGRRMQRRRRRNPVEDIRVWRGLAVEVENAVLEARLLLMGKGGHHRDRHHDGVVAFEEAREFVLVHLLFDIRCRDLAEARRRAQTIACTRHIRPAFGDDFPVAGARCFPTLEHWPRQAGCDDRRQDVEIERHQLGTVDVGLGMLDARPRFFEGMPGAFGSIAHIARQRPARFFVPDCDTRTLHLPARLFGRAFEHAPQQFEIADIACHGAKDSQIAFGVLIGRRWNVTATAQRTPCRLQRRDAAEIRRMTERAADVGTDLEWRHTCGERSGSAARRATRYARYVVGIVRRAVD